MSKFDFNFFLDTRKTFSKKEGQKKSDKIHPISVNIYDRSDRVNYAFRLKRILGKDMRCSPTDFESIWGDGRFKKTASGDVGAETTVFGDKKYIRDVLKVKQDLLEKIISRSDVLVWGEVKDSFNNHKTSGPEHFSNVYDAIDEQVEKLNNEERHKYAKSFVTAKTNFKIFNGSKNFSFLDIKKPWLESYERTRRKTVTASSVGSDLRNLRTIYNIAATEDEVLKKRYPFKEYKIPKADGTNRGLSKQDLKNIKEFKSDNWYLQMGRDYFMLSYYARGMNLKDLAQIKKGQTDYIRAKTKFTASAEKKLAFKINDEMREIISRHKGPGDYLLDILDDNDVSVTIQVKVNNKLSSIAKQLKHLVKLLDLPAEFSYMWAKHSVATNLVRGNVDLNTIKDVFGHTDITTTVKYVNSLVDESDQKIDDALEI